VPPRGHPKSQPNVRLDPVAMESTEETSDSARLYGSRSILAPHVDVDLNSVVVVVINARQPSIVGGGHHTIIGGNMRWCCMSSVDTHDNDVAVVPDSSSSLLNCW
jgi:hypothetical protein